ncbi:nucleoside phosphorylase [Candidatus Riflebacteria bacterium]
MNPGRQQKNLPLLCGKVTDRSITNSKNYLNYMGKKFEKIQDFNGICLLTFTPFFNNLLKCLPGVDKEGKDGSINFFKFNKCGFAQTNLGIGGPAAVLNLEELRHMRFKFFLSIGSAGCLEDDINLGQLFLVQKALRDEGTSFHYLSPARYAFPFGTLTTQIQKFFTEKKYSLKQATSWTTDAPYRETEKKYQEFTSKDGAITVDMETAGMFAFSQFYQLEFASLLIISDFLTIDGWKPEFKNRKFKQKAKESLSKILQFISSLSRT